jgi:hypothetical protein
MSYTDSGYSIDWELKVFSVVCVYAVVKFFGISYESIILCFLGRLLFIACHLGFLYLFIITKVDIDKSLGPSDSKQNSKKAIFDVFRGLAMKAVLVFFLHFKMKMMPPLFISCIMGCFSILECREYLFILQRKFPALAERD